jgi:hypothetical protein
MIPVHAHHFHLYLVSLLDAHGRFSDYPDDLFIEKGFPVLNREDDVIMNLPRTVVSFSDSAFIIHPRSITKTPCSKLQGTFKFDCHDVDSCNALYLFAPLDGLDRYLDALLSDLFLWHTPLS